MYGSGRGGVCGLVHCRKCGWEDSQVYAGLHAADNHAIRILGTAFPLRFGFP